MISQTMISNVRQNRNLYSVESTARKMDMINRSAEIKSVNVH